MTEDTHSGGTPAAAQRAFEAVRDWFEENDTPWIPMDDELRALVRAVAAALPPVAPEPSEARGCCGPLPESALKPLDDIVRDFEELWNERKRIARSFKGPMQKSTRQSYRREASNFAYALNALLGYRKHLEHLLTGGAAGRGSAPKEEK